MSSDTICVIPWVHLNITPQGKVRHCCVGTDYNNYAGDLAVNTVEEIFNSEYMQKLRLQMLAGEKPSICSKCYETENSGGASSRIIHNNFFKGKIPTLPEITNVDGTVDSVDLSYWDFRFSNLCNYKCRSCSPESSSSWVNDAKAIEWFNKEEYDKVTNIDSSYLNISLLEKYLNKLRKIYFSGGEPLLIDEHWQILDMLDQHKKYYVILTYNTNLSKLTYNNKSVIDYWKKWGKFAWVWPSIDEIDERAELIRSGTNWKQLEENLIEVSKIDIMLDPSISVSNMNVFRLPQIIDRLISIGVVSEKRNYQNFNLNIIEHGAHLNVSTLPEHQKHSIKENLLDYIQQYKIKYQVDILDKFLHLFWHLSQPQNVGYVLAFQNFTKAIDKVRNENTTKVIPELEELLSMTPVDILKSRTRRK
jgi:MoaA/NifB/PqqE/SkfB family radical SAM enzyme